MLLRQPCREPRAISGSSSTWRALKKYSLSPKPMNCASWPSILSVPEFSLKSLSSFSLEFNNFCKNSARAACLIESSRFFSICLSFASSFYFRSLSCQSITPIPFTNVKSLLPKIIQMPDPSLDTTRVLDGYILHFRIRLLSLWFRICSFAVHHTKTPMQAVLRTVW